MDRLEDLQRGRCPFCPARFNKLGWRPRLGEHLYQIHRRQVVGETLDWTEDAFYQIELRGIQRSLLLFALNTTQFTVEVGGDSTSLWSMARRGWFTCSQAERLQDVLWRITDLGRAVGRAALSRSRAVDGRTRHVVRTYSAASGGGRCMVIVGEMRSSRLQNGCRTRNRHAVATRSDGRNARCAVVGSAL